MGLGVVMIQTGSRNAKMARSGMDARMGQKAACGAKGGIMDRTKS